ncbi:NADAR family protein [Geopseudomonas aromaticivorans]
MTLFFTDADPFSNWFKSDFEFRGVRFQYAEQMMMYCKAKLFGDDATAAKILGAKHPREHKALGRKVTGYDDEVWSARRMRIVEAACYSKFSQNADLCDLLLGTGDTLLVEASPYDRVWGVGLGADDPRILDQSQWLGQNLLGQVLMTVRDKLALELSREMLPDSLSASP